MFDIIQVLMFKEYLIISKYNPNPETELYLKLTEKARKKFNLKGKNY